MNFTFVFQKYFIFCVSKSERCGAVGGARSGRRGRRFSLVTPTLNSIFPFLLLFSCLKMLKWTFPYFDENQNGDGHQIVVWRVFQYKQTVVCQ